ncbi:unnamed protein product [Rotaria sordida]|uniref:Ion transport domain-containing protein n=1 Tax=Rotaria sordida TaxID=392033 RepID=A0A814LX84_9BILA|nr:unnamed protein product [Rotaria sordida]
MWYHHFDDQRHLWKMNISSFLIFLASLLLPLLPIASVFCPWLYKEDSAKSKKTNKSIQRSSEGGIPWNWQLLRDVFNWGIWKIFGQVAEPYRDSSTDMDVVSENDAYGTFVLLYAIAFVVISNILLLNVLIAMFK